MRKYRKVGNFLLMPSAELKDQRVHVMVTATMRRQMDAARRLPGFRTEADVVRYALERTLATLLADESAESRYEGRTRLLVDTADTRPTKRISAPREPVRLRPEADLTPFPEADLEPYVDVMDAHAKELAERQVAVDRFDAALTSLGVTARPVTDPFASDFGMTGGVE